MAKLTKNQKLALSKLEPGKVYTLAEAAEKVKEITFTKFDSSLDIDVRLGVDPARPTRWYVALYRCLTARANRFVFSCSATLTWKPPQKKQALIM